MNKQKIMNFLIALPFADAATTELPLSRLLRLSLFQISVGMAMVLLYGTLNRVMVVELHVSAWLVSLMVALPLVFAPLRALIGHRSDYHHSAFGWRRVPYIAYGSMLQYAGFAIMPYSILILSDETNKLMVVGQFFAAASFLLVGAGLHTVQTAGLALATDIAPVEKRPRVVALLYAMLLLGMVASALLFGHLLQNFTHQRLVEVVHGAALATIIMNVIALWKQEAIDLKRAVADIPRPPFRETWQAFIRGGRATQLLIVVGLGTAGFSMQEILLEPYGAQVLGLTVSETTALTAILAGGTFAAFALSGYLLTRGGNSYQLAAAGAFIGIIAFALVITSGNIESPLLFRIGTGFIGFGAGLLGVGTLTAAMGLAQSGHTGLALGAWGAVQATSQGLAIAIGGALRDIISGLAVAGDLGSTLISPSLGYRLVYSIEIGLLVVALIVIVPLVLRSRREDEKTAPSQFGLDQML
ncbi:BCD family MFS transporter [Chromatium okenii]|jgi:BCD family chlorophyll transporter-like MFS transporter|uniref:MFS transporter n=1 Tax=Chromatium okenii TaxID=61644 RepID=A0A2S7XV12_9GAMM|nr:BCD family MFS transporter [Chromatium okenii]PQJ97496.1 MFS transporter [Chromatium okenii]